MSRPRKSARRIAIYAIFVAYLIGDLWVFHGPLHHTIAGTGATTPGTVACVAEHLITQSQLERALSEQLWLEGKSAASLTHAELEIARKSALDELIDHQLLRLQVNKIIPPDAVSDEEIHERLRRLLGRFESKHHLESAMKSQGISNEQNLRERLIAKIRQERFIAKNAAPSVTPSDQEVRTWFNENQAAISLPERINVRHIFLPTLDHLPEDAKQKLADALRELTEKKKDFTTLAKELSEDPATKDIGGELGWMTRLRLPADFSAPLFSLEINTPQLLRTRLGWHLVEVTDRKPAEPRTLEQARPEIISALEAVRRKHAIDDFRASIRRTHAAEIEIFNGY